MSFRNFRRQFQHSYGTMATLVVIGYFLYHLFAGDHGIHAETQLKEELTQAQSTLHKLEAERCSFETKVRHLHPESLDRDLLEQRVREVLAYSNPNEVIFVHPEKN